MVMIIINKESIKTFINETTDTYDDIIDLLIPQLIDSICQYCNNNFIMRNNLSKTYVYENKSMTFTSNTISILTTLPIRTYDFILIRGTKYNDGIYQIYNYASNVISIGSAKLLRSETITSAYIALMDLPSDFLDIISNYIKKNIIDSSGNVQREKIDDTEYSYFENKANTDITIQNTIKLSKYRKVFKDCAFEDDDFEDDD
jgi:uncharacterized spore protein YtfJ